MPKTEPHSRLVRVHLNSGPLWDSWRSAVERMDAEALESLGVNQRTYRGRITDSALLDLAVDTALAKIDPSHIKRHPMPNDLDGMTGATMDEVVDEIATLELRLRECRDRITDLYFEPEGGGD